MCARHGIYLGGENPLHEYISRSVREAQGFHREVWTGGSVEQNRGLMNKNLIQGYTYGWECITT